MKVYVVNLKKNPERMESIDAQLKKLGVEYERIEAVYGKELTPEERREVYSPFRAWCARGSYLGAGEIGCALSHLKIYKKMMSEGVEKALVLEDDVLLAPETVAAISAVEQFLEPLKRQVVSFSASEQEETVTRPTVLSADSIICTDMYAITLGAAKEIARANSPVKGPADGWRRWKRYNGLELYRVVPQIARQDNDVFGTDIAPWGRLGAAARKGLSVKRLIWHKCKRLVGIPLDYILSTLESR